MTECRRTWARAKGRREKSGREKEREPLTQGDSYSGRWLAERRPAVGVLRGGYDKNKIKSQRIQSSKSSKSSRKKKQKSEHERQSRRGKESKKGKKQFCCALLQPQ